jgi:hypothetical protein
MEKPLHEWTRNELRTKERVYPIADEYGDEIRAEIFRRAALRNERYLFPWDQGDGHSRRGPAFPIAGTFQGSHLDPPG